MNELIEKIRAALRDGPRLVPVVRHRGVPLFIYRNSNSIDFGQHYTPKNGAAWVEFHQAAKALGLKRQWSETASHRTYRPDGF